MSELGLSAACSWICVEVGAKTGEICPCCVVWTETEDNGCGALLDSAECAPSLSALGCSDGLGSGSLSS